MKTVLRLSLSAVILAGFATAQTSAPTSWIYAWIGNKSAWLKLGPSLAIAGDVLDVKPAAAVSSKRVVGQKLERSGAGWAVPALARNLEVYVNGVHYWESIDFRIDAGVLVPLAENMQAEADVRATFDVTP